MPSAATYGVEGRELEMTKRCLFARCRSCGGLMYINEAQVVTCSCREFSDADGGGWPGGRDMERTIERVRRNGQEEVQVSLHRIKDDEVKP
jgi:hypothetical protein